MKHYTQTRLIRQLGSNQYLTRYQLLERKKSFWRDNPFATLTILPVLFFSGLFFNNQDFIAHKLNIPTVEAKTIEWISPLPTMTTVQKPLSDKGQMKQNSGNASGSGEMADTDTTGGNKEYSQEDIEDYIRTIFGSDARVAIAVSHNECSPSHRDYPACVLHTEYEYSVGIFQINLYNSSHWIHAKKVPGETMEEKIEWLKNPYHNTLIAYKIFSDSGFNPWSAYTNGNYLNDL